MNPTLTSKPGATRLLLALLACLLAFGAGCGGDDDDTGSASTPSEVSTPDGDDTTDTTAGTEPLDEDEARAAGNPETYERIEALTDCDELQREKTAAETNAEKRADDPRRQSILLAYADAAADRMEELGC